MTSDLLLTYLAMDRRHALAGRVEVPDRSHGSVLLADISGFTPLTEALVEGLGPRRGAEELTRLLNTVYTSLVDRVHHFGGSIVCFIGDALVAHFDGDEGLRAVACGLQMQRAMGEFQAVQLPQGGRVSLAMKAAVEAGDLRRLLVGDPGTCRIEVVAGETIDRLTDAEHLTERGEVLVGPRVARRIGRDLVIDQWRGRAGVVTAVRENVRPAPWPELSAEAVSSDALRPYVLPEIHERIASGHGSFLAELRPIAALFLRFEGLDYDGDDAIAEKLDAVTTWAQSVTAKYGGHVLMLTTADKGSHLYAAFGALEAHEDDADRAVAAALELSAPPEDLGFIEDVRIGVSQGRVRVGGYGGEARHTYGALGDTVNLAARLMGVAPPGEVRCSAAIEAAASGFVFEGLPAVALKGMREPQAVFRPTGRGRARAGASQGSLIGRAQEVGLLSEALEDAVAGARRIVLIEGEAGIGKSRLIDELHRLASDAGARWLFGAASGIEQQTPYRAWRDLIEDLFDLEGTQDPQARRDRVVEQVAAVDPAFVDRAPLLNDILPLGFAETALTRSYDPQLRQEGLASLVGDLLLFRTAAEPAVLAFDDVHWMDSLSWELALSVARTLSAAPVLIALTHRTLSDPIPRPYTSLASLADASALQLGALPPEEAIAIAAAGLGLRSEALPDEVNALLRERSEGNPFYALELINALRDQNLLDVEDGACVLTGDADALRESVPQTLEGVILSRIDLLPSEAQLTLKAASVIGRGFLLRTLDDVSPDGAERSVLRDRLRETGRRRLTLLETEEPEPAYAFEHAVTQYVAYDTLLYEQRRALHREVAGWIESEYAEDLLAQVPLLVVHWNRAGHEENERRYCRLAGEQAASQSANVEALGYFDREVELVEQLDRDRASTRRFEALRSRSGILAILGQVDEEREDLEALRAISEAGGAQRIGSVALLWSDFHRRGGRFAEAIEEAEGGLELLRTIGDPERVARALTCIGRSLEGLGRFAEARGRIEDAVAIYRGTKELEGLAGEAIRTLGIISARLGEFPEAMARFGEAHELFRRLGDRRGEAQSLGNIGAVNYYLGEYETSIETSKKADRLFAEIGSRAGRAVGLMNIGSAFCDLGAFEKAPPYFEQAITLYRQLDDANELASATFNLGMALHAKSVGGYPNIAVDAGYEPATLESALLHYSEALEAFTEVGNQRGKALANFKLGTGRLTRRDAEGAERHLREALGLCREIGLEGLEVTCLSALARARLLAGDARGAAEFSAQAMESIGSRVPPDANELHFTHYRALDAVGQHDEAVAHLERSREAVTQLAESIRDEALREGFLSACRPILEASA